MPAHDASDDEDEEGSETGAEVLLGFLEEVEQPAALLRHRFPSKVGGRPAWLDPVHLPSYDSLSCPFSGKPLQFLLQVYAPAEGNASFHRTLYLFISPEGDKLGQAGTVRAFRCQLGRENPFYSFHPPEEGDTAPPPLPEAFQVASLQLDPWRVVEAESEVAAARQPGTPKLLVLFPEWELLVEPDEESEDGEQEDPLVQRALEDYRQRVEAEGELDEEELPESIMEQVQHAMDPEQRHFAEFQAKLSSAPEQCLRYSFHADAEPLWPSTSNRPSPSDIPPCPLCGAPRHFEFQVLPQLLNSLAINELDPHAPDWGTIAVYSCSGSCCPGSGGGSAYAEEFCWVQPP